MGFTAFDWMETLRGYAPTFLFLSSLARPRRYGIERVGGTGTEPLVREAVHHGTRLIGMWSWTWSHTDLPIM